MIFNEWLIDLAIFYRANIIHMTLFCQSSFCERKRQKKPIRYVGNLPTYLMFLFFTSIKDKVQSDVLVQCPLRFPHNNDVLVVFISNCLQQSSCLIYVICVCLHIVVSNTQYVVFLFCLSSSCVPYVASFSVLYIFHCPFGIL